jgi:hypothetical protein
MHLLDLAHRFEKLIRDGDVRDYAELARLGHVSEPCASVSTGQRASMYIGR